MASDALFQELAKALGRPSKAYRAASAVLDIPEQAAQGYEQASSFADKIRARKMQGMTLEQALGGSVPSDLGDFGQTSIAQLTALEKPLSAIADLQKSREAVNGKPGEYFNPEQTAAVASGDPAKLAAAFSGRVPRTAVTANQNAGRNSEVKTFHEGLVGTKQGMLQNAVLNTALRYSAAGMAQSAAKDSVSRLSNINRAQQLIEQIQSQGGNATGRQRTELASAVGRSINPTGVLTNEALNLYIPDSLRARVGTFQEYMGNESIPVDFSGFLPELGGLLGREKEVNQSLIKFASDFGAPATEALAAMNPRLALGVSKANKNPLLAVEPKWLYAENAQHQKIRSKDNWATFEPVK